MKTELPAPGRIGRGTAAARGRAAMGPLTLRGSIARAFPGGVLPDSSRLTPHQEEEPGRPSIRPRPSSGGQVSIMYSQPQELRGPYRGQEDGGRAMMEGAETESRSSDPVTEIVHERAPNDPYAYMLSHFRDMLEDQAYRESGEPLPPYGEEYPHAAEIPPVNGTRPRVAALRDTMHGAFYQSGLYVEQDPVTQQFEDEMDEPGEAITRLLSPGGPHAPIPRGSQPQDGNRGSRGDASDDGFELLDP